MKLKASLLSLVFVWCASSQGFIPPVSELVNEAVRGRGQNPRFQLVMQHRVFLPEGGAVVIEEEIVRDGAQVHCLWSFSGGRVRGRRLKDGYEAENLGRFRSRSRVFLDYITADSSQRMLSSLLSEKFVRKEQLAQFEGGYKPQGDPRKWNPSEYYVKHRGIFLTRLDARVVIVVQGLDEPTLKKSVFFDRNFRGLAGLRWEDAGLMTTWQYSGYKDWPIKGKFPATMILKRGEETRVASQVIKFQPIGQKDLATFERKRSAARFPATGVSRVKDALEALLAFR